MKALLTTSLAATLLVGFAGCAKDSSRGGPGATNRNVERSYRAPDRDQTFTLSVPSGEIDLERGESKVETITIKRGDDFDQPVTLRFKAPEGLTLTPSNTVLKPGTDEVKLTVVANDTAPLGESWIETIGTPATGRAVSVKMQVEVKERD